MSCIIKFYCFVICGLSNFTTINIYGFVQKAMMINHLEQNLTKVSFSERAPSRFVYISYRIVLYNVRSRSLNSYVVHFSHVSHNFSLFFSLRLLPKGIRRMLIFLAVSLVDLFSCKNRNCVRFLFCNCNLKWYWNVCVKKGKLSKKIKKKIQNSKKLWEFFWKFLIFWKK